MKIDVRNEHFLRKETMEIDDLGKVRMDIYLPDESVVDAFGITIRINGKMLYKCSEMNEISPYYEVEPAENSFKSYVVPVEKLRFTNGVLSVGKPDFDKRANQKIRKLVFRDGK